MLQKARSYDYSQQKNNRNSEFDMMIDGVNKKRNKENLADRFIPSKISSDAYHIFAT